MEVQTKCGPLRQRQQQQPILGIKILCGDLYIDPGQSKWLGKDLSRLIICMKRTWVHQ